MRRTASRFPSASRMTGRLPECAAACEAAARSRIRIRCGPGTSTARPPHAGQIFRNPDLARTLRLLQAQGADAFYKGEIAQAIVAKSTALGGTMTLDGPRRITTANGSNRRTPISRLRYSRAAAALPGVGGRRDAEHSAGLRAAVGAGRRRWHRSGPANPLVLALAGGGEEARLRRSVSTTTRIRIS